MAESQRAMVEAARFESRIKAIVADGDNTLWRGAIADTVGRKYIFRELGRLHLRTFVRAASAEERIRKLIRSDPINGPAKGFLQLYDVLVQNRVGREEEMYRYAERHVSRNRIVDVNRLLRAEELRIPLFLVTAGGSTGARAAGKIFNARGTAANEDLFDASGRLCGINITIRNGVEKREAAVKMLRGFGIELGECVAIGDSEMDRLILEEAGMAVASPFAVDEIRRIAHIQL